MVCDEPEANLTLMCAPAGFGKTTMLAQCRAEFERHGISTMWLTLDGADNEPARFVASLGTAFAGISGPVLAWSDEPGDTSEQASALLACIEAHPSPFALFLDDAELITDAAVLVLLTELLRHLPPHCRLLMGARSQPDLKLQRFRLRGQLLDLGSAELRFSADETNQYLNNRRMLNLSPGDVSLLHEKTDGWITGLWLASLALVGHAAKSDYVARFSGSETDVAAYLAEDVVARLPREVRAFLLRTSILCQLTPSLCEAVAPGAGGEGMLQQVTQANLLLTRVDNQAGTYRYHSLFSDYLQSQLAVDMPEEVPVLHQRASAWFEANGDVPMSVEHALTAADHERAMRLIWPHTVPMLKTGRGRTLIKWFSRIPEDLLSRHPELQMFSVWALCFIQGPFDSMAALARSGLALSNDPAIISHISAFMTVYLCLTDHWEEAMAFGAPKLANMPTPSVFADVVLVNSMAHVYAISGEHQEAIQMLDRARYNDGRRIWPFNVMYSEAVAGMIAWQEARMNEAREHFLMAESATRQLNGGNPRGSAWAGVLRAAALYESNQLVHAESLLSIYVPVAREFGMPDHVIVGHVLLSRIAMARGDVEQAFNTVHELKNLGHRRQLPRVVASAQLERSRLLLLQGHRQAAKDELQSAGDPALWQRYEALRLFGNDVDCMTVAALRWEVLAGDLGAALSQADVALARAEQASRYRRALILRLFRAAALWGGGRPDEALRDIELVLSVASAEGFVRLLLDEAELVRPVLQAFGAGVRQGNIRGEGASWEAHLVQLLESIGPLAPGGEAAEPLALAAHQEPLTRKELQVLQLLAEGLSNSAMAQKLFVSESTTRTHLRNINSKLDARSRTQAVAIGRRLGIIA